ncbi:hypothetical protein ACM46_20530 [Chryseobacterium angstadtii]|uniref:DUF4303 domain-containing protein n=1 Tax=Chryseobacterium angstadtii TaxID=558151 RepID=A0A0J7HZ19_9FLAO|nr:hypothetical protein [Chryseobacterium angstadtii]KMQ59478.1 hypothetical protein ACM46_20530 [Chryseobacterium angstadtii]
MQKIETQIDEAFKNTFLLPREKAVTQFLVDVLHSKYKFREDDKKIEVISLYYYASSPLSFLFALPNYEYYSPDKTIQIAELHLKEHSFEDYSPMDVQELCKKVLDQNNIDYSAYLDEHGHLDYAHYWENQFGLESNFIMNCWKNAKEKTQSKMLGFLESSDGESGMYDLDNNYVIPFDVSLDEYLRSHGFIIKGD